MYEYMTENVEHLCMQIQDSISSTCFFAVTCSDRMMTRQWPLQGEGHDPMTRSKIIARSLCRFGEIVKCSLCTNVESGVLSLGGQGSVCLCVCACVYVNSQFCRNKGKKLKYCIPKKMIVYYRTSLHRSLWNNVLRKSIHIVNYCLLKG